MQTGDAREPRGRLRVAHQQMPSPRLPDGGPGVRQHDRHHRLLLLGGHRQTVPGEVLPKENILAGGLGCRGGGGGPGGGSDLALLILRLSSLAFYYFYHSTVFGR